MNEFLDTKQAAEWLRISRSTLAKKRISGDGPPYIKTIVFCETEFDIFTPAYLIKFL